jgi:glutamine amidotransferase
VRAAPHVVLPGVGAFGAAMELLSRDGLTEALIDRLRAGRPTLAICLGLQLLCQGSDESPGVPGLGVVPGRATRLPNHVRVPQMGWNMVEPAPGCRLLRPGYAYFANSFRLATQPPQWEAAWTDHGGPFVAAMERGALLACQFHPELSGAWGLELIGRWLQGGVAC